MRRDLSPQIPALMRFYPGFKPWDLERMTLREVTEVVRAMEIATQD